MTTKNLLHVDPAQVEPSDIEALTHTADSLPPDSPYAELLHALVDASRRGTGVTALLEDRTLSPNEAAQVLGISRPHLMKAFVRTGALKITLVGKHHRISHDDLLDFKARRDQASKDVATALSHKPESRVQLTDEEMAELDQL